MGTKKDYSGFLEALAEKESSKTADKINPSNYIGLYQLGEGALIDVGYYQRGKLDKTNKNDWTSIWTGKDNINSKEDFLKDPQAQTNAIKAYHTLIWYLKEHQQYQGKIINGIEITKSGMIAAAHLVGQK